MSITTEIITLKRPNTYHNYTCTSWFAFGAQKLFHCGVDCVAQQICIVEYCKAQAVLDYSTRLKDQNTEPQRRALRLSDGDDSSLG